MEVNYEMFLFANTISAKSPNLQKIQDWRRRNALVIFSYNAKLVSLENVSVLRCLSIHSANYKIVSALTQTKFVTHWLTVWSEAQEKTVIIFLLAEHTQKVFWH
jgi:hypothetical protein